MNRIQLIGLACVIIGLFLGFSMICVGPSRKAACVLVLGICLLWGGISICLHCLGWHIASYIAGGIATMIAFLTLAFSVVGVFDRKKGR